MKQLKTRIICILFFLVMPTFDAFSQTEDFFTFIKQFCLDSTFQQMRTINPLEVITWDNENDEKKLCLLKKTIYPTRCSPDSTRTVLMAFFSSTPMSH